MAKTEASQAPVSPEAILHSVEAGRRESAHAWSRACTLYSSYFAALADAETPAAIMQANVHLLSKSMEVMGKSLTAFQHIAASAPTAKH